MSSPPPPPDEQPGDPPPMFDAHLHIVDPRFPLTPNDGFVPAPFTVADYRRAVADLPLEPVGGAVVSGSFQAYDQTYLVSALDELGAGYVGVTQLPVTVSDDRVRRLDRHGVRAVRCNLRRGAGPDVDGLEELARRVHRLAGWHLEVYVDGTRLADLAARLAALPQVVIDHLGLSPAGLDPLLDLVAEGAAVKASGFGRADLDVRGALARIAEVDAGALLFGTDLPSTRAPRPFRAADIRLVREVLGEALARRALCDNARALYDPPG